MLTTIYGILHLSDRHGPYLLGAGIAAIVGFVWFERSSASPVLDIRLFSRNRVFAFSNLAAFINYSAVAATAFLLSLYLQDIKGLAPQMAGLVMLSQPCVQALISPFAGKLSDKIEPRIVASAGMAATATALGLLSLLHGATSFGYIIASLVLLGVGFALFSAPNTNAIMGSVSKKFYSIASATQGTMTITGMNLSMGIVMLLLSIYIGRVQMAPEHHANFLIATRTAFAIFAVLCAAGVFASLARGKLRG